MIGSMEGWIDERAVEKPVVILEVPRNRTSEHIDVQALYDHVKTALMRWQVPFLDNGWQEIAEEYEYQDRASARRGQGPGNQRGARYIIDKVITSTVQQVGSQKSSTTRRLELTDIATTEIVWTKQKEITKHFKKQSIGF